MSHRTHSFADKCQFQPEGVKTTEKLALEAYYRSEKLMRLNERQLDSWLADGVGEEERPTIATRDLRVLLQNIQDLQEDLQRLSQELLNPKEPPSPSMKPADKKQVIRDALVQDLIQLSEQKTGAGQAAPSPVGAASGIASETTALDGVLDDLKKPTAPLPVQSSLTQDGQFGPVRPDAHPSPRSGQPKTMGATARPAVSRTAPFPSASRILASGFSRNPSGSPSPDGRFIKPPGQGTS